MGSLRDRRRRHDVFFRKAREAGLRRALGLQARGSRPPLPPAAPGRPGARPGLPPGLVAAIRARRGGTARARRWGSTGARSTRPCRAPGSWWATSSPSPTPSCWVRSAPSTSCCPTWRPTPPASARPTRPARPRWWRRPSRRAERLLAPGGRLRGQDLPGARRGVAAQADAGPVRRGPPGQARSLAGGQHRALSGGQGLRPGRGLSGR